jgi:hypothetical protein
MSNRRTAFASRARGAAIAIFALGTALAAGCGGAANENIGDEEQPIAIAESSYVSDFVVDALDEWPLQRGRTWNVTHDNRLLGNWLVQTPAQPMYGQDLGSLALPVACTKNCDPDFQLARCETQADCTGGGNCAVVAASVKTPGSTPQKMCVGHSDAVVDQMYSLITSATKIVDVTSLTPPDGRFEAAVRNAITYLSQKPNPPQVRLLFGTFPVQGVVNTTTLIKNLTRDVPRTSNIDIAVGAYRSSDLPASWNHSKMIAVDGNDAIVGGHNMWTKHYLSIDPVHDLSMRVRGSAAGDAHRFANVLWKYTCENMTWVTWLTWSVWVNKFDHGNVITACPRAYDLPVAEGPSTGTVISVGRLGAGIVKDGNQSDVAVRALMRSARKTLRMSLQDIGPVTVPFVGVPLASWPDAQLGEIAAALGRGVEVYIVLSNLKASTGGLSATEAQYANGWSLEDVGGQIRKYMESHAGYPRGADLTALLCTKLHLAPLRYGRDEAWPDGVPFANHDKTISVDEQAFYIGSQNMYPVNLQEFGYIVDDSRATATYLNRHWAALWGFAEPRAISGEGAATCSL